MEEKNNNQVVFFDNGYYLEVNVEILDSNTSKATSTRIAKKTATYKNSSGEIVWFVTVNGTFTYTGTSSTCTSSTVIAQSNVSSWKIDSKSASKSGNKVSAKATAKEYFLGFCIDTITKTVTLICDKNGNVA